MTHNWVSTRNLYHTSWTNNGGRAFQAEGIAVAKIHTGTNPTWSRNWKKADMAEAKGKGESGRRQGHKGRQGQEDLVTTTHEGTLCSNWHTASTQEMVAIVVWLFQGVSFLSPGKRGESSWGAEGRDKPA